MADVFISYATKDAFFANELCDSLEKNGISCWISPRNCSADKPYSLQISMAIKECKVYIVLISDFSNESEHVRNEVDLAFTAGKDIICYRLGGAKPAEDLNYYLGRKKWIDCTGMPGEDKGTIEIIETIQKKVKGEVPIKTALKKIFRVFKKIFWWLLTIALIFTVIQVIKDVAAHPYLWKEKSIVEYLNKIWAILKSYDYKGLYEKIYKVVRTLIGK